MKNNMKVINGNNIDILKQYPDNYFDAIVTDPPYGLGKEPNAEALMKDWIEKGYHEISGTGFMGKEWDAFIPQPVFWKEVFRVLKHGGHVLSFFGTRTYDWGVMSMRFAGFEVRDCIQWLYGCLSDDTEILTRSGYIQYHSFIKLPNFAEKEILIYDIENDIYKWEKPERWNEYNIHKDTCYRIKSDNTDQIVSRNHRCLVEREGKLVFIQAEHLAEMEYMPTLSDDFLLLQESKILQSSMQRTLSGSRMEEVGENRFGYIQFTTKQNKERKQGRKKPCLERGNNLSEKERVLFRSEIEVCEMPNRIDFDGEERWLHSGISFSNGETIGQTIIENGMRTSYRPQPNEQRYNESNVVCNKQGTQTVRVGRSYSTTLATITPIEYSGIIFCPTVSTGAFVARRKGKSFVTGNSGFPKSHNISKAIDKMYGAEREVVGEKVRGDVQKAKENGSGYLSDPANKNNEKQFGYGIEVITKPSTDFAKQWDGWGSALKPANEPIVLARKPLEKGLTIAENVLKWGTGAINIDGCRIGFKNESDYKESTNKNQHENFGTKPMTNNNVYGDYSMMQPKNYEPSGRFPANLILTHHEDCECVGTENGEETVEDWNCVDDCPIKILDEQSGESKSVASIRNNKKRNDENIYGGGKGIPQVSLESNYSDKGGASRFFYVAKASKSERNKGLDEFEEKQTVGGGGGIGDYLEDVNSASGKYGSEKATNKNFHPTVKPIKLMQYLVRLITPPNGIVLDPFCGSGTTGVACKLEGFQFVGLEQDADYAKIAQARIDNYEEEKPTIKKSIKIEEIEPNQLDIFKN
jgi:site-specific DNA-methyltransferase (adenine-specific)